VKLYTEEQVRQMLVETDKFTPLHIDLLIKDLTPIELPSDEEISEMSFEENDYDSSPAEEFERGAIWIRDKIQGGNK
jgi:hypothetical protein